MNATTNRTPRRTGSLAYVIDPSADCRAIYASELRQRGWTVLEMESAASALLVLQATVPHPGLIISEGTAPGVGRDHLPQFRSLAPHAIVIVTARRAFRVAGGMVHLATPDTLLLPPAGEPRELVSAMKALVHGFSGQAMQQTAEHLAWLNGPPVDVSVQETAGQGAAYVEPLVVNHPDGSADEAA